MRAGSRIQATPFLAILARPQSKLEEAKKPDFLCHG